MNNAIAIRMTSTDAIAARARCAKSADATFGYDNGGDTLAFAGMKRTHTVPVGSSAKWSHFAFPTPPRRLHEPPGF